MSTESADMLALVSTQSAVWDNPVTRAAVSVSHSAGSAGDGGDAAEHGSGLAIMCVTDSSALLALSETDEVSADGVGGATRAGDVTRTDDVSRAEHDSTIVVFSVVGLSPYDKLSSKRVETDPLFSTCSLLGKYQSMTFAMRLRNPAVREQSLERKR